MKKCTCDIEDNKEEEQILQHRRLLFLTVKLAKPHISLRTINRLMHIQLLPLKRYR